MAPAPKRQPAPGDARIDWADPITKGLALYFLPATQPRQDLARRVPLSYVKGNGTYDRRGTEKGQSLLIVNDRSNNQYTGIDVNGAARPKLSGPFTLMFYGRPSSFTSSFIQITGMISAFADQGSNGPVLRWGNDGGSGQSRKILAYANIGGQDRNILAPTDSVAGTDYLCLMTYDGAVFSLWVNGVLIGSIACSGAVGVSAYNRLTIGADYVKAGSGESSYGNRHFAGDMYAVAVWERGFTFEECKNFTAYQPLKAHRFSIPLGARATTAPPLDLRSVAAAVLVQAIGGSAAQAQVLGAAPAAPAVTASGAPVVQMQRFAAAPAPSAIAAAAAALVQVQTFAAQVAAVAPSATGGAAVQAQTFGAALAPVPITAPGAARVSSDALQAAIAVVGISAGAGALVQAQVLGTAPAALQLSAAGGAARQAHTFGAAPAAPVPAAAGGALVQAQIFGAAPARVAVAALPAAIPGPVGEVTWSAWRLFVVEPEQRRFPVEPERRTFTISS